MKYFLTLSLLLCALGGFTHAAERPNILPNLVLSQPAPLDVLSLHEYGNFNAVTEVGRLAEFELLRAKVRAVHAARAPVFIGEFGQRDPHLAQDPEAKWTRAAIDLLDEKGVALIALWVWHFPRHEADHNITTGVEQPLLMKRVADFNRNYAYILKPRSNNRSGEDQ